jgi:branched-subunit amino acid aminotransferase/4-amino-4-deoxychorismate lyase
MSLAYWNGRTVPGQDIGISPDDAGFLFGDGLFETLRVDLGAARDVEAHLDRLLEGLRRIGIDLPEDREEIQRAVSTIAEAAPRPTARLRITITRGQSGCPTRLISTAAYQPLAEELYRKGVGVRLLPQYRIDSSSPLAGLKSLCYQANRLALRAAESQGAWEALLINERGRLVEGSRSNLALVLPDGAFTPPRTDGCLPGTVRRRLLESGEIQERPLAPADLETAREVLLMNSLVGVLPVSRIDSREVPVGPVGEKLRNLFEKTFIPTGEGTTMSDGTCSHLDAITTVKHAKRRECEECVKIGSSWVHLRTCQECGVTLCCDSSPNRHATKHAHATGHPVIASAEPGERWLYCYPDEAFTEY